MAHPRQLMSRRELVSVATAAACLMKTGTAAATSRAEILALPTADGRTTHVSIWRAVGWRRGTILFSHGAQSAPGKYQPLTEPWTEAGFDVLCPLHVDSTDHPDTAHYQGLASWAARIEDMRALAQHVKDPHYVAAGHSYGALVALTLGGATAVRPPGVLGPLRDPRVRAVLAFSPPGSTPTLIDAAGYATLAVPALIQTGSRDIPPRAAASDGWKQHLLAYDAAAAGGNRYALVLEGADHFFGGLICWLDQPGPPQRVQIERAAELSVLFLNGYGAGKRIARRALDSRLADDGPTILRRK